MLKPGCPQASTKKRKSIAFEATGTMLDEGVGMPSLPQGGSIGQPPAYLLSSAAPAPFTLVLRDPRRPGVLGTPADFDRDVAEHNIPEEEWPETFARWIAERTGGPAPRFEKVAPGNEQILEDREQRDLDAVPSFLALRQEQD